MKRILTILFLFLNTIVFCIETSFSVTPQKKEVLIGDQFDVLVKLTLPQKSTAQWPKFNDTLSDAKLEIIEYFKRDTLVQGNSIFITQKLLITCFDTGYIVVKPIPIVSTNNDTLCLSAPELIQVKGIVVNPQAEIKPIKEPIDTPFIWQEIKEELMWSFLALISIIVVILLVRYFKKKNQNQEVKIIEPTIPPHELALQKLMELERKQYLVVSRIKDYHSELTDILREYLEKKYHIDALELTSAEILAQVKRTGIENEQHEKLRRIFALADGVKFAKMNPSIAENELALALGKEYIINEK